MLNSIDRSGAGGVMASPKEFVSTQKFNMEESLARKEIRLICFDRRYSL
jgi:hypothetical protein